MERIFLFLALSPLLLFPAHVQSKIEPTKFQHNKVYALENQHTGKYLTAGVNGEYLRTGDHGTPSKDQLWKFIKTKEFNTGKEGWQLMPVNGSPAQPTVWNENYAGHGKFRFKSIQTGNCLEASERGVEVRCVSDDLFMKWYPHPQAEQKN